jgi:hypothetical protein
VLEDEESSLLSFAHHVVEPRHPVHFFFASVVLTKAGNPLSGEDVESHLKASFRRSDNPAVTEASPAAQSSPRNHVARLLTVESLPPDGDRNTKGRSQIVVLDTAI